MEAIKQNDFAAFVMTYERPEILLKTISRLQSQTFPPKLILIVDNSESLAAQAAVQNLLSPKIMYFRVGFNSGPAGAANLGLARLTQLGFHWIYWGDDDNPPRDNGVFEALFQKIDNMEKKNVPIGILSGKGGYFNKFSGSLRSLSNYELENGKILEVDAVPGGHTMLVNAEVVKKCILPTKKLFFGFEDLDFCLKIKKNGFKIFIDAENWLATRHMAKNTKKEYQWKDSSFGKFENLDRDYYTTRNLLYIFYKNKMLFPFLFLLAKIWGKLILGFKFGWNYGMLNIKTQGLALFHFIIGKYGAFKIDGV